MRELLGRLSYEGERVSPDDVTIVKTVAAVVGIRAACLTASRES